MVLLRTIEDAAEEGDDARPSPSPSSPSDVATLDDWRNRSKFHSRQAREKRKRRYAEMRGGAHGLR